MAQFMRDAGYSPVEIESKLQPLSGEEFKYQTTNRDEEARSDIKRYSFWKHMRQYFDIKVCQKLYESKTETLFRNAELSK